MAGEFIVSAKLIADNRSLVKGVSESSGALVDLTKAERQAAEGAKALAVSSDGLPRAFEGIAVAARAQKQALDSAADAARKKQHAMRGLGLQMGDLSTQLAAGINPAVALGQQLGQVALAAEGLGGRMGAVAAFLNTPWGAAVQFGAIVLGTLTAGLLKSEDAAKKTAKATDIHKMSTEDLIKAINDESVALGRAIQTTREAEVATLNAAASKRREIADRRQNIVTMLEEARTQAKIAGNVVGGGDLAYGGVAQANSRVSNLERQLKEANDALRVAQQDVNRARIPLLQRGARAAIDPQARISEAYDARVEQLNREFTTSQHTIQDTQRYNRELQKAIKVRDDANKALQESAAAERKSNKERGRTVSAGDVSAILKREFGGTITDTLRARNAGYGAKNSYHKIGQAVDFVPRGGMGAVSKAQIRAALEAEGISLKELLGPGDKGHSNHFHAAFGRRRLTGEQIADRQQSALAKEAREAAQATKELEREQEGLERILDALEGRFDKAADAAGDYADVLRDLQRLKDAGKITDGQFVDFGAKAGAEFRKRQLDYDSKVFERLGVDADKEFSATIGRIEDDIDAKVRPAMEAAGKAGAEAFRDSGVEAARSISALLGGKVGHVFGDVVGLLTGLQTGNYRGVGGKLGGLIGLFSGSGDPADPLTKSFGKAVEPLRNVLDSGLKKLGTSVQGVVQAAPYVAAAIEVNKLASSVLGNDQVKNGKTLGVISPFLTAAFGSALRGTATINSVDGDPTTRGNSRSRKDNAIAMAQNIQGVIGQIADAFGGTVGDFSGSIGMRKKRFVVDPTGRGRTKGSGVMSFKNEADAQSALLRDLMADGAVQGLSAAVQRAIMSNKDIDKSLREALKVQEVEDLLGGLGATMKRQFKDFEKQAAERLRIARQHGFDVVALEKRTTEDRQKLFDQILGQRVGPLKDLLADLNFGDLFEGSGTERRNRLIGEISKAQADAEAGIDGAADKLANLNRTLLQFSREQFGTAGGEFGSDLARARTGSERVIQLESERVRASAEQQKQTNAHLDENNNQNAEMITRLKSIESLIRSLGGHPSGGSAGNAIQTGRQTQIR